MFFKMYLTRRGFIASKRYLHFSLIRKNDHDYKKQEPVEDKKIGDRLSQNEEYFNIEQERQRIFMDKVEQVRLQIQENEELAKYKKLDEEVLERLRIIFGMLKLKMP